MTHLRRAIEELRAVRYDRGRYAYWADEIRAAVVVDSDDMRDFGRRLARNDADAYSLWCAATSCEHLAHSEAERIGLR